MLDWNVNIQPVAHCGGECLSGACAPYSAAWNSGLDMDGSEVSTGVDPRADETS